MADFKDIRDTVISTLATAAEKTKDFADKAVEKAKDVSRVARLNIEMNTEKQIAEKAYSEIGKLYYETRKDNPDGFFVQLCDEITLAKENMAKIQEEIDCIKAGDCECKCNDIEVDFTVVTDEELAKDEVKKDEGCGCGCGCADSAAPEVAAEPAEEPKE